MSSLKISLLTTLRNDLITFLDELSNILPNTQDIILMKSVAKVVIISDVADYISKNLVPLEDKVINREEKHFLEHAVMFENLQDRASTVNHFRDLWMSSDDEHDKETVWEWLHHFILLAKKYETLR
jgi:hypothetical protein